MLRGSAGRLKPQGWVAEPEERAEMRQKEDGGKTICQEEVWEDFCHPASSFLFSATLSGQSIILGVDCELSDDVEQQLTSTPWGVPQAGLNSSCVTQDWSLSYIS